MTEFDEAKKKYEEIEIPSELNLLVRQAIKTAEKNRKNERRLYSKEELQMSKKYTGLKVAACVAVLMVGGFTVALNTNESFAKAAAKVPVLESIAKVMTFRSYQEKDADKKVTVEVPHLVTEGANNQEQEAQVRDLSNKDFMEEINQRIDETVQAYVTEANGHIADYKEAFLATGGTEEEFAAKNIKVDVTYDVKCDTANMLSFVLTANENWSGAYGVNYYYNLNLETGTIITLKDLLGEDYIEVANAQIKAQMEERVTDNEDYSYFTPEEGGFETIDDMTQFYINEAGNPVIAFEKYAVAPGFMGVQEFEIKSK